VGWRDILEENFTCDFGCLVWAWLFMFVGMVEEYSAGYFACLFRLPGFGPD
jgi:hypothetical protein